MNISKTIIALVVLVAGMLGFGDVLLEGEVATVVDAVMQIVGVVGVWYGRLNASGQIDWLGRKV